MAAVTTFVVDEADVEPVREDGDTASVRVTFDESNGSSLLEQRVVRFAPGSSRSAQTAVARHDVLYVVSGRGELDLNGARHVLEPGTAAFVCAGETYTVDNAGPGELLIVSVLVPADGPVTGDRKVTVRFDEQPELRASSERTFRYLVNEDAGCHDATQFIGLVQPSRATVHSHPYDEVGYVVEGEGIAHVGGRSLPLRPGSCFHLPPHEGHSIENTGTSVMRILGVFHPAGSPATRNK